MKIERHSVDENGPDWRAQVGAKKSSDRSVDLARAREKGRGREATTPEQIPPRGWWDILWRVFWSVSEDRILSTAGSVAFFALLAVFPGIAAIVSVYGLFADPSSISELLSILSGCLPNGVLQIISDILILRQGNELLGTAFALGLLISLVSSNSGMAALFDALNVVYDEREKRSLIRFYCTTFLFTRAGIGFIILAIAGVVVLPVISKFVGLQESTERLLSFVRWPILLVTIMVSLACIYRYGPSRRDARWRWLTWGSLLGALLWVGTSMLFSWYVATFDSYNKIYGSLGAGVGFMVWLWISVVVVLLGAELNAQMEHQTARDTTEGGARPLGSRGATMADHVGQAQSS
jgi:membrane protein